MTLKSGPLRRDSALGRLRRAVPDGLAPRLRCTVLVRRFGSPTWRRSGMLGRRYGCRFRIRYNPGRRPRAVAHGYPYDGPCQ